MSTTFRILVVCTGNICRSAQAEQIIRARTAELSPELESVVSVDSAGTQALVEASMPDEAAALSAHYGGNPEGHSARQLTVEHVREADLVLAMTAEHRSAVVRLLPRASRYSFTLTEFAALLESAADNRSADPPEMAHLELTDKLRCGVEWASTRRGYLPPDRASMADVVDPYRRSNEVYEESLAQILHAIDRIQRVAVTLAKRLAP